MKIENKLILEVEREEKSYRMELPSNAPLGESYSAAGEFMDKIVSLINEYASKRKEAEKEQEEEEKEENQL